MHMFVYIQVCIHSFKCVNPSQFICAQFQCACAKADIEN